MLSARLSTVLSISSSGSAEQGHQERVHRVLPAHQAEVTLSIGKHLWKKVS